MGLRMAIRRVPQMVCRENCTLKLTASDVSIGGDPPKPPHDLGGVCHSQVAEESLMSFIMSNVWVLMKVRGESASKRATSCIAARPP